MNVRLFLNRFTKRLLIFLCAIAIGQYVHAQCATPISSFPYNEGFETSNGGFTSGGIANDWAWGTPAKPVINSAATGTKCWIVGGLTGNSYNDGERSWLQSPCFDFTAVQHPYISFAIFWEMEQRFDGAGFQYSTNLGATWTNVGSVSDPANCLNSNWFNFSPITNMNGLATIRDGWSGNIQPTAGSCLGGNGSSRWVNAQHTMPALAGVPNVIFRFIFGAGTQCNAYDGFAVDDIMIGEAPPNNASFTFSCINSTTGNFTSTSALCPALSWDFGDPASGPGNNTSTLPNPIHVFSAPGQYTITLTATGPDNGQSVSLPQTLNILGVITTITGTNNCAGDNNGSATVNVIPAVAGPFFYSWNTTPVQTTQTATGLTAGTYTVTVNAMNTCQATATAIITAPAALAHTVNIIQPGCGLLTGTATITETGGTAPYTYAWAPSGGTGPTASGLAPGNYTVTVTDSKGCFENINIVIANATSPTISITSKKDASCFGFKDGSATALAVGGNAPYTYSWNTVPVQNTATATNLAAGLYSVTVSDNNGCQGSTSVQITEPPAGSCGDVYFPNAFTPNGDAKNPDFGVLGNVSAISNYLLLIYNRYGELVFYTRDAFKRWDGFYKGKQLGGSYVWVASFTYKGSIKREEKGSVTIMR
jgi:gliding motility-associated-like protein/surface-anchored protein